MERIEALAAQIRKKEMCIRDRLQGLNARQISEVRVVAQDTVKTQIHSIREKFGCARTKEIVLRIRELGLEYLFR